MSDAKRLRGLYAITPDGVPPASLCAGVAAVLRGGARLVQYRDKNGDCRQRAELARSLIALCRQSGARLLINDDVQLAIAVQADGVHLGADDGDLVAARAAIGADRLLGVSCYASFQRAGAAVSAGADYVAVGAVHPSSTKPGAVSAPLSLITRCRAELGVPVCAIGGITVENAAPVLAAGADLLAVISDLFAAADMAGRAAAYNQLFREVAHDDSK